LNEIRRHGYGVHKKVTIQNITKGKPHSAKGHIKALLAQKIYMTENLLHLIRKSFKITVITWTAANSCNYSWQICIWALACTFLQLTCRLKQGNWVHITYHIPVTWMLATI
jgi:hypothetical protein